MPRKLSEVKESIRTHESRMTSVTFRLDQIAERLSAVGLTKPAEEIEMEVRDIRRFVHDLNPSSKQPEKKG